MNFVTWSIRNPVPVIVLFIGLTVAGLISFPKLGVLDRPDIEFPAVIVTITYPGVAPTQMESEITRKVEDAVATIAGIEQMTSTVDEGASTTSIEFRFGTEWIVIRLTPVASDPAALVPELASETFGRVETRHAGHEATLALELLAERIDVNLSRRGNGLTIAFNRANGE